MGQDTDVARVAAALRAPAIRYRSFGNEAVRTSAPVESPQQPPAALVVESPPEPQPAHGWHSVKETAPIPAWHEPVAPAWAEVTPQAVPVPAAHPSSEPLRAAPVEALTPPLPVARVIAPPPPPTWSEPAVAAPAWETPPAVARVPPPAPQPATAPVVEPPPAPAPPVEPPPPAAAQSWTPVIEPVPPPSEAPKRAPAVAQPRSEPPKPQPEPADAAPPVEMTLLRAVDLMPEPPPRPALTTLASLASPAARSTPVSEPERPSAYTFPLIEALDLPGGGVSLRRATTLVAAPAVE